MPARAGAAWLRPLCVLVAAGGAWSGGDAETITCDSGETFRWLQGEGASADDPLAACEWHLVEGITLQPCVDGEPSIYTLRAASTPRLSLFSEISWIKACHDDGPPPRASLGGGDEPEEQEEQEEPAGPPSTEACGEEAFARLRSAAADFYASGVVSVHLLLFLGEVLREAAATGWRRVAARCAPGVLATLLLRAEERLYVDAQESRGLKSLYLDLLHDALGSGEAFGAAEWPLWPTGAAWTRVRKLEQAAEHGRGKSGATVDFVLCFCGVSRSPGGGYPAIEDGLDWLVGLLARSSALQAEHRGRTRVFVKEKCGESVDASLEGALRDALSKYAHVVDVERVEDQLRADDATAYLAHLAGDRYRDLAEWTFFLHADAPEHVHPFRLLEEVFAAAISGVLDADSFPFLYLSHNYLDLGTSLHTWDDYASPALWKRLFGSSVAPPRSAVKGYCCVQFMVPRRRLLLRPREFYARALLWFAAGESYWRLFPAGRVVTWQDLTCRAPAQLWMPWWHVVFGEALAAPERHLDPRLPLFVQLRSIPPDRIQCC